MDGVRQEARLFFGERLLDSAAVVSRPTALMRHLITPGQRLPVALGQRSEGTACPEGIADIADSAFYAPFLISSADLTGARDEVVVGAQLHQPRVEVNLAAAALEHSTAEIVIENHAGLAGPSLKSVDMTAQEVPHCLIEEELQVQRPRIGERDHEAGERPAGTAARDLAGVGPINLCLFGGEGLQA